ncbi:MAG: beta-ketoacyl-[acyl-carrier-protein] synthase family protein [Cyclobacteriaceae bacterium]|nr:beta-ketoacyl-[acyl-carrier-protein] synthase family protein [Cyclobacteriaceae bacterium SS2]
MADRRVVITGLGVVASNGVGVKAFDEALKNGTSGIKKQQDMVDAQLRCQIGGIPEISDEYKQTYLPDLLVSKIKNHAVINGLLAGLEAWKYAGLPVDKDEVDNESGIIMGSGALGLDYTTSQKVQAVENGLSRKLGSFTIPESMSSGAGAFLNSLLGLGNRVLSNSSACSTGSEAVLLGYEHIASGKAERMLCGSTEGDGIYIWGGFDALRVLCADSNDEPTKGSRPISNSLGGFVPSSGAGALVLESLESAKKRGANILAEFKGGYVNSGGQRNGGSLTAPNFKAIISCIKNTLATSKIEPGQIDLISGHLTSTPNDVNEVKCWVESLGLEAAKFPFINTPKSMIGHSIAAAGSIELVACVLQLQNNYIHPNINCDTIHPELSDLLIREKVPSKTLYQEVNTLIKANFGFGDLNCCVVLQKWKG